MWVLLRLAVFSQLCSFATLRSFRFFCVLRFCSFATLRICHFAPLRFCASLHLQLCAFVILRVCNFADFQLCAFALLLLCTFVLLRLCFLQVCNLQISFDRLLSTEILYSLFQMWLWNGPKKTRSLIDDRLGGMTKECSDRARAQFVKNWRHAKARCSSSRADLSFYSAFVFLARIWSAPRDKERESP